MNRSVIARVASLLVLTFAFVACACQPRPHDEARKKINLGNQQTAITLVVGSNNDLNIASGGNNTTTVIRLIANASNSTLTGVSSTLANVGDGDLFLFRNEAAAGTITITNEDSLSVAANRFLTPSAAPITLQPKAAVWVEWDKTSVRWIATPSGTSADHVISNSTAPALTSCGTSPAVVGSDVAGVVTTGSAATTCTITFARTYTTAPSCYFLPTGTATMPVYTVSATAITVATDIASTVYNYGCTGR